MSKHSCPRCHQTLPFAARRCRKCRWIPAEGEPPIRGISPRSRRRFWAATLLATVLVGVGLGYLYVESLASRYAGFAARYLPSAASALAPTRTDEGAFYFCIRQVSKEMDGEFSVETFPSLQQSDTVALAGGYYRIRSFVDETRATGERVRHAFTCTVRFERGRWMLEELALEPAPGATTVAGLE